MNFKKYTKAELISKLESKISNLNNKNNSNNIKNSLIIQIKTYFSQLLNLISLFKDILIKLTFISIIIKLIRKYSIFRRIWTIFNTIIVSIFGLSIIDNFGFEFINNLLIEFKIVISNTIDYLSNTKFYSYLSKLFSNNLLK